MILCVWCVFSKSLTDGICPYHISKRIHTRSFVFFGGGGVLGLTVDSIDADTLAVRNGGTWIMQPPGFDSSALSDTDHDFAFASTGLFADTLGVSHGASFTGGVLLSLHCLYPSNQLNRLRPLPNPPPFFLPGKRAVLLLTLHPFPRLFLHQLYRCQYRRPVHKHAHRRRYPGNDVDSNLWW